MAVTGMLGSLVYWRASRRRAATSLMEIASSEGQPAFVTGQPGGYGAITAPPCARTAVSRGAAMVGIDR